MPGIALGTLKSRRSGHANLEAIQCLRQTYRMKTYDALAVAALALTSSCLGEESGRSRCTAEVAGRELGANTIEVTILVPPEEFRINSVYNRGIFVIIPNCDYMVDAFFSKETAQSIILSSRNFPLQHKMTGSRLANAKLSIYNFQDGSPGAKFFVRGVLKLSPSANVPKPFDSTQYAWVGNGS